LSSKPAPITLNTLSLKLSSTIIDLRRESSLTVALSMSYWPPQGYAPPPQGGYPPQPYAGYQPPPQQQYYDASSDVAAIRKATKGSGTDEAALINILARNKSA